MSNGEHKPISLRRTLAPLASLKLTVVLIALSIFLVLAGTLAQVDRGIWDVMHDYFRSPLVFVPINIFLPREYNIPIAFPFPGGYTIGLLMLVNLLAAHTVRFRLKARGNRLLIGLAFIVIGGASIAWFHQGPLPAQILSAAGGYAGVMPLLLIGSLFYAPMVAGCAVTFGRRGGIVLIHASLALLLIGEGITAASAVETQMPIYVGASCNWAQDIREVELALIDPSSPQSDLTIAISEHRLQQAAKTGEVITHPAMPVSIMVNRYEPNVDLRMLQPGETSPATSGFGVQMDLVARPKVSGVDTSQGINVPGAIVTILREGLPIGTYLVSPHLQIASFVIAEQEVPVADRMYRIALRFRRYYKPYTMRLDAFHHDLYPGTGIPRNFSSDIHILDKDRGDDHDVVISMNNPLRYQGETFFQSSWIPGDRPNDPDKGTILMVVRNPGWTIPYIACAAGLIGLCYQFGATLLRFLRKGAA
ncbi:MAG: cytochrome c biogenesis protein ResB [Phycisphaerales bacterium]|nr:cytochrome c biogenesis protein ResB [Phycisphaerales bacterium]